METLTEEMDEMAEVVGAGGATAHDLRRARKAAIGGLVAAVVDWYDFLLYGFVAALVFNSQFFPNEDKMMGTIAAFATLGVGFLFRPLGGVVFGHYGDKYGRKLMLVITVTVMGVASALIGLLPTYAMLGWLAPVLLVVLRIVQGIAAGGEWGGAALLAVESAPEGKKALYSSGVQVGYGVALVLVTGIMLTMSYTLSNAAFLSWGWRVPFLISVVLVGVALWLQTSIEESPEFTRRVGEHGEHSIKMPVLVAIRKHPGAILMVTAMRSVEMFAMYVVTTFALAYSVQALHMSRNLFLNITFAVGAISCVSLPLFAWLADRVGFKRVYLIGAAIGVVCTFPFFYALESGSIFWIVFFSIMLANVCHDMVNSVQQVLFTGFFGTEYRYSGANIGYQVGSVLFGGFTPFIATALFAYTGNWYLVAGYMVAGCLLSFVVAACIKFRN